LRGGIADEAIQDRRHIARLDCFASLAKTTCSN
jgi:hypothetical protein